MNKTIAIAACALALCTGAHAAQITSVELARPGGARHYLMATPEHGAAGKQALVILFHGHGGSAKLVLGRTSFAAPLSVWLGIAEREQVLIIAPDGIKGSDGDTGWNDCRADAETSAHSDDSGFVGAIIDQAIAEQHVDPARIYVMGVSNGAGMVLRLASDIGPRLAGFAAVSMSAAAQSLCPAPSTPLSALFIAGSDDKLAPYAGGKVGVFPLRGRGSVIGVDASVAQWRALDHLADAPVRREAAHRLAHDPTRALRSTWGMDPHRLQVQLLRIEHGGHLEPSIAKRYGWGLTLMLGAQNGDVEVAEEAWAFFKDKRSGLAPQH